MRICVFCGSSSGHSGLYADAARRLGEILAASGIGLVYGGSRIGLMGVLADTVLGAGGSVIGVIPQSMVEREIQHGALTEHPLSGVAWQPFLYQPPFFTYVESRWFTLVGESIFHARILGVMLTGVMQVLLFRLLWRLHGAKVALFAILPIIFDGWLLYIERVSYIEHALIAIVVLGFLLYKRALDNPSWHRFLLAGVALGSAACFKQTGAYVVVAALVCWLITRRAGKGHLILLGGAVLVIATYLLIMIRKFDAPGYPWYIDQSLHQVLRVLGSQHSGGTLTSPTAALHLLAQEYAYFVPSVVVAVAGMVIALRRTWQCIRARSWRPVRPNALLYSWLMTGAVVFGVSSLKFPQYFVLILLPSYCFLWTELARMQHKKAIWRRIWPTVAIVAGLGSFLLTVPALSVNTLQQVQAYAAGQIPANAIVVTEQSIGDLINQPWCTVEESTACVGHATYAITWQTYLESSAKQGDASFAVIMNGATKVTSFSGPVGTATVWKLRD